MTEWLLLAISELIPSLPDLQAHEWPQKVAMPLLSKIWGHKDPSFPQKPQQIFVRAEMSFRVNWTLRSGSFWTLQILNQNLNWESWASRDCFLGFVGQMQELTQGQVQIHNLNFQQGYEKIQTQFSSVLPSFSMSDSLSDPSGLTHLLIVVTAQRWSCHCHFRCQRHQKHQGTMLSFPFCWRQPSSAGKIQKHKGSFPGTEWDRHRPSDHCSSSTKRQSPFDPRPGPCPRSGPRPARLPQRVSAHCRLKCKGTGRHHTFGFLFRIRHCRKLVFLCLCGTNPTPELIQYKPFGGPCLRMPIHE